MDKKTFIYALCEPGTRRKLSAAKRGRSLSVDHRDKIGRAQLGHRRNLGRHHRLDVCLKMSESRKGCGNNFFGKLHTENTKEKMRTRKKGVPWSAARRAAHDNKVTV